MAKKVERSFDGDGVGLDLQQLVRRLELLVDTARRLGVTLAESADHGLDLRADDMGVDAHSADPSRLEQRKDDVVVPRVEVEIGLRDDPSRLDNVVIRLLDRPDGRDLGELDNRFRLDVDHDPARDVVDNDRTVADVGDGAEVLDDPARRGLVVVGSDDEKPVYTNLVRFTREVDGVSGGVRPSAGDDGAAPVERVDRDAEEIEPLVVAEGGTLPGGSGDDEPIGSTLDEVLREFAEALEVDRSVPPKRRDDGG